MPQEVIDELLSRFSEVGLVNDASFAAAWVQSRHEYKHSSKAVLRKELKAKGVSDDEINSAVEVIGQEEELAAAQAIAQKRLRTLQGLPQAVVRRRLVGALSRRGFSAAVVSQVVSGLTSGSLDEFVWDETEQ